MPKSMINTCCNLYFYYNFIVHGGIRHLESFFICQLFGVVVHGGIRHLENWTDRLLHECHVHGGIRHLEIYFEHTILD